MILLYHEFLYVFIIAAPIECTVVLYKVTYDWKYCNDCSVNGNHTQILVIINLLIKQNNQEQTKEPFFSLYLIGGPFWLSTSENYQIWFVTTCFFFFLQHDILNKKKTFKTTALMFLSLVSKHKHISKYELQ